MFSEPPVTPVGSFRVYVDGWDNEGGPRNETEVMKPIGSEGNRASSVENRDRIWTGSRNSTEINTDRTERKFSSSTITRRCRIVAFLCHVSGTGFFNLSVQRFLERYGDLDGLEEIEL